MCDLFRVCVIFVCAGVLLCLFVHTCYLLRECFLPFFCFLFVDAAVAYLLGFVLLRVVETRLKPDAFAED